MRASVGRDHARSTQHLDLNSDVSRTLSDPVVVVVGRRTHRARHAASDAALEGAAIEPGVSSASIRAGTSKRRPLALIARALLCLFGQLRHATIRRIDHERGAWRRDLGATVPPEVVVGALDVAACPFRSPFIAGLFLRAFLERGHFLLREELAARHIRGSLERRDRSVRVGALQIGLAPGRARRGPVLRARRIGAFSSAGPGQRRTAATTSPLRLAMMKKRLFMALHRTPISAPRSDESSRRCAGTRPEEIAHLSQARWSGSRTTCHLREMSCRGRCARGHRAATNSSAAC